MPRKALRLAIAFFRGIGSQNGAASKNGNSPILIIACAQPVPHAAYYCQQASQRLPEQRPLDSTIHSVATTRVGLDLAAGANLNRTNPRPMGFWPRTA